MKIKKVDYANILGLVNASLEDASVVFGLSFNVESILLYGSQLTSKEEPNDIDVFVKVNSIKIKNKNKFLKSYGPTPDAIDEDDLMEIVYIWLHENQPAYQNTPIDINFRDYDFDMDGKFESLI